MAQNTRTWAEAVGLTQARAGSVFANGSETTNVGFLLNSAARTIYDESRYWERYLVLEPRTVSRGYVSYTEDSYNVYGAGTDAANGLYTRDGDFGAYPKYTISGDGVEFDIVRDFTNVLTVAGAGTTALNGDYTIIPASGLDRESYEMGDGGIRPVINWNADTWIMTFSNSFLQYYGSGEDVPTADLVTTWLTGDGDAPAPATSLTPIYGNWVIRDSDGVAIYENTSTGSTPPESGWTPVLSTSGTAPIVQALSEIGEYIGHWDGAKWECNGSKRGLAYPDQNGIRIANCDHGDVVYVAFKKSLTETFGDGEGGSTSEIPAEWMEFMSYDAARAFRASKGSQDGFNPVTVRDVNNALDRALMKVSRQGINETIALYFRTIYGYDVSVT